MTAIYNKEKYRLFCDGNSDVPIFCQPWWLDTAAGDAWDVCIVEANNSIVGYLPYTITNKFGFTLLSQPSLTQHLGPLINVTSSNPEKEISSQNKIIKDLIEQLPPYSQFTQTLHISQTNWLPFYWNGFNQTTRYTYRFDELNLDQIWDDMRGSVRRDIKDASQKKNISINDNLPLDELINLDKLTYKRKNLPAPYSENYLKNLATVAKSRDQCKWFVAQDKQKNNLAWVLIVWDSKCAYNIVSGINAQYKSRALPFCYWEAIRYASSVTKSFDFEGSMMPEVEKIYRYFGAKQKPYFFLEHSPSKILKARQLLKKFIG